MTNDLDRILTIASARETLCEQERYENPIMFVRMESIQAKVQMIADRIHFRDWDLLTQKSKDYLSNFNAMPFAKMYKQSQNE